jgi:DNA-binding transcriptional LysR family regulator
MNQLNLNLLRALHALLTCANVTHAAAQLNVTQSAMSRNLSLLRDHLGDPLLIREGTRYLLTDRAKQLLPRLHSLMFDIKELFSEEKFDPAGCRRSFVMASSDYVAQYIFPSIVDAIHRVAPQIQLHYRMMEPPMLEKLGTLPVDLVATLVPESPENLYGRHLGSDYPVCAMAENHPLAGKKLTLEGLTDFPHLCITGGGDKDSFLDRYLAEHGRKRNISVTVPFFSSAFQILARSQMLLTIPLHIAVNARRHFPITHQEFPMSVPTEQYYLLWHGIHHNDPAHRWLREQILSPLMNSTYGP